MSSVVPAGHNPETGEWNDSLAGDYLWSNVNVSEAVPGVMTPCTWSLWQIYYHDANPIKIPGRHPFCGNIGGRPYLNLSLLASLYRAVGQDMGEELHGDLIASAPKDLRIPIIPFRASAVLWTTLPGMLKARWHVRRVPRQLQAFVTGTPHWCRNMRSRIRDIHAPDEWICLWRDEVKPYFFESCRLLRGVLMLFSDPATKLHRSLARTAGEADANVLLSNLAGRSGDMESLGPLLGLARVSRGEMSRDAYMERYGHRSSYEMELSAPGPDEDPDWLERRLAELAGQPTDVDVLLAAQRARFADAWQRFREGNPRQSHTVQRQLDSVAAAARTREAVRSEVTRVTRTIRRLLLRASDLTGLGDGVFFLSLDELVGVMSGNDTPVAFVAARRKTHDRYCALPPYPPIIVGGFDPFRWAADPHRRSDYFDSRDETAPPAPGAISGCPGAPGRVEGLVRRLDSAEEGDQLLPGEILVTTTTNVGWTPVFPRAAAVVTDVGAPLSHAAIVARELGIPAVVGCGNATMLLHTGDRVRVDGGRGVVEILTCQGRNGS